MSGSDIRFIMEYGVGLWDVGFGKSSISVGVALDFELGWRVLGLGYVIPDVDPHGCWCRSSRYYFSRVQGVWAFTIHEL